METIVWWRSSRIIIPYLDTIDMVTFGPQGADTAYARIPNGTGNFVKQATTFNANNELTLSIKSVDGIASSMNVFPNPTTSKIYVEANQTDINSIAISNLMGQKLYSVESKNTNAESIDLSEYPTGIYILTVNKTQVYKVIKQ